jgi:hypothetical protein
MKIPSFIIVLGLTLIASLIYLILGYNDILQQALPELRR